MANADQTTREQQLEAALRAVVAQARRTDCSPMTLVDYCRMEAERGLSGRAPMWTGDAADAE